MQYVIKFPILLLTLAIWAVVGFVFWLPLLARATALFSVMVLYVNLTRVSQTHLVSYNNHLNIAVVFYVDGFRRIIDALYGEVKGAGEEGQPIPMRLGRFLFECSWTLVFWFATLCLLAHLGWLPDQVLARLAALSDGMRSFFDSARSNGPRR
jgi:hypothetical protein